MKLSTSLLILISSFLLVSCNQTKESGLDEDQSDNPKLAMCVVALRVVDDETDLIISRISGVNFIESLESIKATNHASNPLKRASSRKFTDDEGIILASWIDSATSPSQLVITAEGYEPLVIDVMDDEKYAGTDRIDSPRKFSEITRTVRMKRSEQGGADQPATAPQSKPTDNSTSNPESKPRRQ